MQTTRTNLNIPDKVTVINPDGSVTYEPNLYYQQPTVIRRTYRKAPKRKYRYVIEQEGKAYRCCQWCRYWCTRNCSLFDFCDRIIACPLLCFILSAIFLLLLLIALLTLFGLHPNINSARRYYGVISTLSIVNQTKYVYGLDKLCNQTGPASLCLNITTSTAISYLATTVVLSQSKTIITFPFSSFIFCTILHNVYPKFLD